MNRREFLKTSVIAGSSLFFPKVFFKDKILGDTEEHEDLKGYAKSEQFHVSWEIDEHKSYGDYADRTLRPALEAINSKHLECLRKGYKSQHLEIPDGAKNGKNFNNNGMKWRYVEVFDVFSDKELARIDILMVKG